MSDPRFADVIACFENAEDIYPSDDPRAHDFRGQQRHVEKVSQMPQMPQRVEQECKPLSLEQDRFEERAAIIEYDGGLPRALAEFLAGR
ncbi:hypothetical protein [Roseovarius sp.]|uniref:hypothetical protein n=1 Tax=Roseovarius sp. TaxID=1486281 RepID=UPI003D0DD4AD